MRLYTRLVHETMYEAGSVRLYTRLAHETIYEAGA